MASLINTKQPINVSFGKAALNYSWKDGKQFERIPIHVDNQPLLLKTAKCFSLGAKQNVNKETGEEYGWVLQICLLEGGEEREQREFLIALQDVIEQVKQKVRAVSVQGLVTNRVSEEQVRKIGGCLWSGENDERPILYAKIISNKGRTSLYNSLLSKQGIPTKKENITECCYVQAVICVDSVILHENKAHLKVQVYEANIQDLEKRQTFL